MKKNIQLIYDKYDKQDDTVSQELQEQEVPNANKI